MIFNTLLLATLASTTFASPILHQKRVVHEQREGLSTIKGARIEEHAVIPIRIALKQTNLQHGYDVVMDVSDPDSPNYGKHWSKQQVQDFFAPPASSLEAVKAWLLESGVSPHLIGESEDRAWVGANIPVWQAEDLLSAEYHEHHGHDDSLRIGCDEYSLPSHISDLVDYIKPGIVLSPPLDKRSITRRDTSAEPFAQYLQAPTSGPAKKVAHLPGPNSITAAAGRLPPDLRLCGYNITPACQRALYDIPLNTENTPANNFGIAEFGGQAPSQSDLNKFYAKFATNVPQNTGPTVYSIEHGPGLVPPNQAGDEADIDFEIAISLVYPQTTTLYSVGKFRTKGYTAKQQNDLTFVTPLLDAIDGSFCTKADKKNGLNCGTVPVPRVLSVSYSSPELYNPQKGVERSCNEFMKLSLQGSTIIFASGDYGVSQGPSNKYNGCINPDYKVGKSGPIFSPPFPADCPYVLAVGATQLYANETINDPEHVMFQPMFNYTSGAIFSSSGGFSNYYTRPSWQDSAVQNYLDNYVPNYAYYTYNGHDIFSNKSNVGANGGIYNRAGRGIPDVSSNGANYTAYYNSTIYDFYGTSLAAPTWGSVITLINEQLTKAGKSPAGFVQPLLYKNPQAFHDITLGNNPGCGTQGFPASPGWDPVTGLGTPNFPALLKVFMNAAGSSGWNGGGGGWNGTDGPSYSSS